MHFTIFTLTALFAANTMAQTACDPVASAVPTCGIPCIQSASSDLGCPTDDYACRCSNADAISGAAIGCVVDSCGFLQALEVQASASAVCGCVATAAPDAKRMVRGMGW